MKVSLDLIAAKCEEIGFTISKTKTKSIAKTRDLPQNRLQLQGHDIEWVDTHKYLGVVVARANSGKVARPTHLSAVPSVRKIWLSMPRLEAYLPSARAA